MRALLPSLGIGVGLGLVLIVTLSAARTRAPEAAKASVAVTDDLTRIQSEELAPACWEGLDAKRPARATVALAIAADGEVVSARASGAPRAMASCLEAYARRWSFLPQGTEGASTEPTSALLRFEVAAR